ncbi:uncharacterized protein BDR25DRAFT_283918 [Lindgomyces ingoldianus]|uniref:Uncharacterized protein n=1 Tax=Lindgomyces ingoldianus TaxID=673940 RepID=A0ACB6QZI1_9PLEO|nr:uncharacterized protein BDR25DRAFT_283918 [Lindgomyces ingoldianus]KAF2472474.1 hypothetical protein BDR25DRAFT_283918 [Lindgomyces ingoldianus]
MPPALSDEENDASSGEEEIPYRGKGKAAPAQEPEEEQGEEEEEGEEDDDEVFVVEKILGHMFNDDGVCMYEIKWMGYDRKKDRTWEPEDNLSGATDVLNEYFDEIGGRPQPGESAKSRKRKGRKSNFKSESGTPAASSAKRPKREKDWSPPPGSWENDVEYVDTVEESIDNKTGQLARFAYLVWTNQKKTQHPLKHCYRKCPQKMLEYYESHLVFTTHDNAINGEDKEDMLIKGDDI